MARTGAGTGQEPEGTDTGRMDGRGLNRKVIGYIGGVSEKGA